MDFARKQLEKYGWTDGKGLGKNENGISEALKPKLKRSVAGIGHDAASDFTEHWWTALYDKATSNVQVENHKGKTKGIKIKDEQFKITNSTWKLNKVTKTEEEEYSDYFVKKAVLSNGGSRLEKVCDSDSDEEEMAKKDVFKMTDEELFAACEGRTAHKGARHGLKALGKLARIERQEQMLLKGPQYNGYSHAKNFKDKFSTNVQVVENANISEEGNIIKIKKKKKKQRCSSKELKITNDDDKILKDNQIESVKGSGVKDELLVTVKSNEIDNEILKKSKKRHLDCKGEIENYTVMKKKKDEFTDEFLDAEMVDLDKDTSKKITKRKKKRKSD